jgi:hypothetical protein
MKNLVLLNFLFVVATTMNVLAQEVPIVDVSVDVRGRIQIQVESSSEYYYVLYFRHDLEVDSEHAVSVTLGEDGTTMLTEQLAAYPTEHYRVIQYRHDEPADLDGDSIDDMEEFFSPSRFNPLNPAGEIDLHDGAVSIPDRTTFEELSYQGMEVLIDTHLENLEYVKFYIFETDTDNPEVYFMNTETHRSHFSFADEVGIPRRPSGHMRGEIIYHPYVISPNGEAGVYRFEFEPNDNYAFEFVQKANELLAANMPILRNNLAYYPMPDTALMRYYQEKELYDSSRVSVLLWQDIYANVSYLPLNLAEGYGLLRVMELGEWPNSRDIVIYESLPNEMTRVGGIITTVPQTPLSHVNLRAIQDNIPNAYIENALEIETIANLIRKYVYFKVDGDEYEIREATLAEVESHYANLRPTEPQFPTRDLSVTSILPLDEIDFESWSSFGVKTANLATLRTFGFPEGTIPDGFGIPFYFYDEFMKFNGFYEQIEVMLADHEFLEDYNVQDAHLSDFRDAIKDAEMPEWMWDALTELQNSFPEGTSIRCRSSTNNEDLPGFSGAGLYDSKTQHPDEGHISKSIKQVFASLWNFRAFDARQFYRVNQFAIAMGVLTHPNYSNERANGVGVTMDPIYQTEDSYYLNTQVGEDLVTNPESSSIPEEILLDASTSNGGAYTIVRPSNQVADGEQVLSEEHINQLRTYFGVVHNEFSDLYTADLEEEFAMEIEYKVTEDDKLVIKQARPWIVHSQSVSSRTYFENNDLSKPIEFVLKQNYPNPFNPSTKINYDLPKPENVKIEVYNTLGQRIETLLNKSMPAGYHEIDFKAHNLPSAIYFYRIQAGEFQNVKKMILLR